MNIYIYVCVCVCMWLCVLVAFVWSTTWRQHATNIIEHAMGTPTIHLSKNNVFGNRGLTADKQTFGSLTYR